MKSITNSILEKDLRRYFSLPEPQEVSRSSFLGYERLRKLLNDPHVWSCVQSRKSGLLSLKHKVKYDEEISNYERKAYEEMLKGIDIQGLISSAVNTVLFGFSLYEIIWDAKKDNLIAPQKFIQIPYEIIDFEGNLPLLVSGMNERKHIPENKYLYLAFEDSFTNPYGTSLLSKCYWAVKIKNAGLKYWINYTEKYGTPIVLGKYRRGVSREEADALAESLTDMHEDTVLVAPEDVDVEIKHIASTASTDLYERMIKLCNNEISKVLLSQTLTTEIETGSYAAANIHFRVREEVIKSDASLIEKLINSLLSKFAEINFRAKQKAFFSLELPDSEIAERLDRDIKLLNSAGIKFSKKYWQTNYGFNESDFE